MKQKLTTLLFGLLLAVGGTSSAFAQTSPNNIPDAVYPKSYYDALTYEWENPTDGEGVRTSKSTDLATDPYQIYELLRFVYGNPAFPGPKYGAYTSSFVREDPIEYGPIQGGWNIVAASSDNPREIKITANNNYAMIQSIEVKSGNTVITSWTNGQTWPPTGEDWSVSGTATISNAGYLYISTSTTITIPASKLTGYNNVDVVVKAWDYYSDYASYGYYGSVIVNGTEQQFTGNENNIQTRTWSLTLPEEGENVFVQGTVATPFVEGYTALMVSVYDDATPATENPSYGCYYSSKQDYVNYIAQRIKSVQLLTDGLRIGSAEEHNSGTVFNCSGTYNKFFIISKGQAREKSDWTKSQMGSGYGSYPWYTGEVFPFQTMYEQFSPTTGDKGSEITDFYTEMQDGHVYSVVHDCASVIQEKHQFSMSGNNGTQNYAMSGLNFFIPDYRLLYWNDTNYYIPGTSDGPYSVDGRDMNAYQYGDANGKTNGTFITSSNRSLWACYFAQYNPEHAPKVGIYKITLEANAKKAAGYDAEDPNNRFYDVTLNWVSSLNELSGEMVPQTYEIYIVHYNEDGTETQELLATVTDETTYTYQVLQTEESQTITYIIKGYPTPSNDSNYPSFVAWSNLDDVVIPGLNDFLNLILDHYESDFVIGDAIGTEKNYYRNFMHVAAENEDNALTVERINAGENLFTLYRYDASKPQAEQALTPVGELTFWDRHNNKTVGYGFTFATGENGQVVEPYTLKTNDGQTITNAYSHDKLGMPQNNNGFDLRIKGNGDIVIQPNGYDVNFYEISVYDESNTRIEHWQVSNGDVTSLGWYLSPGSKWVRDPETNYYYLEGGGFIAIPDLLNNNELRVVVKASRDAGKLGQIKVNDHTMTVNSTTAQDYEWTVSDKYYKYVRVLNSADLTAGEYLIVSENEDVAFDGSKGVLDAAYNNLSVEILRTGDTHEILESALIDNATFTIDPSAGTVKSASGYYIGLTANSNGLRQSTSPITNVISVDGNEAHIKNQTNPVRELRYNASTGTSGKRFRYYPEGTQQSIQLYKKVETTKPVGESIVRLGSLPIIDQFAVSVADNEHPNRYGYVLKYVPGANVDPNNVEANKAKTSSHIEVPVQKTGSVVNGFYTVEDIEKDVDHNTVFMDNISADMQMNLSNTNSAIFYYSILNKQEAVPHITADSVDYVSNLQNDNFVYQEMFKHSPNIGDRYEAGEHHYFDGNPVKGTYGKTGMTYVPFITTRAIERFYFVEDSVHNTYGSPIWATSVGKVEVSQTTAQKQMKQVATENGGTTWVPNPSTSWTANGEDYTLYFLSVSAEGLLPSATVSNVPYEPYMFRVFIEDTINNKLRKFKPVYGVTAQGDTIQTGLEDDGPISGKYCVGSYDINSGTWSWNGESESIRFSKGISNVAPTATNPGWSGNMMFGAPFNANPQSDFRVYVRFYYMKKGWNTREGDTPDRPGNGSESRGQDPGSDTGIFEIFGAGTGEVVSTTYYNAQGMQSDKPFDGLNIVVTRYSNGTTSTTKVIR